MRSNLIRIWGKNWSKKDQADGRAFQTKRSSF